MCALYLMLCTVNPRHPKTSKATHHAHVRRHTRRKWGSDSGHKGTLMPRAGLCPVKNSSVEMHVCAPSQLRTHEKARGSMPDGMKWILFGALSPPP